MLIKGMGWVQDFLAWPQGLKDYPKFFREHLKIYSGVGMCGICNGMLM